MLATSPEAAHYISTYCLPLGLNDPDRPWDHMKRATATLLNAGERYVFLTCNHVLVELDRMKVANPKAHIVLYPVDSPQFVEVYGPFTNIDHDERLDVAIIGGPSVEYEIPGRRIVNFPGDRATELQAGDAIAIAGYPAANISSEVNKVDFGYMYLLLTASSVSPTRVVLADESGDRRFFDHNNPPRPRIFMGGLSGSPAFHIRKLDGEYTFVGIVTDCSESDGTILVSIIPNLHPDGTFDRHVM